MFSTEIRKYQKFVHKFTHLTKILNSSYEILLLDQTTHRVRGIAKSFVWRGIQNVPCIFHLDINMNTTIAYWRFLTITALYKSTYLLTYLPYLLQNLFI